jgi:uncharacterized membrane protein
MSETNPNSRLEAFCEGVFAIALTLLIVDIKIPPTVEIKNTGEFWLALRNIAPSIFAFVLSFIVIFITWTNHHSCMKFVNKTSASFIYANGFLLFTVVFIPFPTSLLGQYILTDHSAPSVVLYNSVLAAQAIAWILLCSAALKDNLTRDEPSAAAIRVNRRNGYAAFVAYSSLAIIAFWFPKTIAAVTTLSWIYWLIFTIMH